MISALFNDIATYFKFIDLKKNMKIGLSSVGKMHVVCAILRNALTCLYGNQNSRFFELDPPSLHEYFVWTIHGGYELVMLVNFRVSLILGAQVNLNQAI